MEKNLLYRKKEAAMRAKKPRSISSINQIVRKLKNKNVILYNPGECLKEFSKPVISNLNIVGISDASFLRVDRDVCCGYKKISPQDLKKFKNTEIVICSNCTKEDKEFLEDYILEKHSKIKVVSLFKKSLFQRFLDLFK